MFSKQEVYCISCGKKFETNFQIYHGIVCGYPCFKELEWKKTLSILGKEYYQDPDYYKWREKAINDKK